MSDRSWMWSWHNEYNHWLHSAEAKRLDQEGKSLEDYYELHYIRGVGETRRDYTSFYDSARDTVTGMKEEFDYWCRTPEGQRAWRKINELNGSVRVRDMMDYYASVVAESRRNSSSYSRSSSIEQREIQQGRDRLAQVEQFARISRELDAKNRETQETPKTNEDTTPKSETRTSRFSSIAESQAEIARRWREKNLGRK